MAHGLVAEEGSGASGCVCKAWEGLGESQVGVWSYLGP